MTGGTHLPGRDREGSFPPAAATSDPRRGFPCAATVRCGGARRRSRRCPAHAGRDSHRRGSPARRRTRLGRPVGPRRPPRRLRPRRPRPRERLSHPPEGEDGPTAGRLRVSSPRVGPPLEGPCAEPRRAAASGPCEEGTAQRRRPRPGQSDRGPPSDVAGPDSPARGHRPLHLRVRRRPRSGPAGRPGGFADLLSSHRIVLLRLNERSREGEGGAGGGASAPGARSRTRASRGAPHDAPRIGIVRALDSGVFGIRT